MSKDLSKPCDRCGSVDRYESVGRCRRCWKEYVNARNADPTYKRPKLKGVAAQKPCPKCGTKDRYSDGGCKRCRREAKLARRGTPCPKCTEIRTGPTGQCLRCTREYANERGQLPEVKERRKQTTAAYAAKPEAKARRAARNRFWSYGVTETEQAAMLEAQNNCCDSCGDPFIPGNRWTEPHLDHNHETDEIRAFTCGYCNAAAGHVKDSPVRARKLADYLERHAAKLVKIKIKSRRKVVKT